MKKHLAIMKKQTIEDILSGRKIIETRFSKAKIAPFGQISKGDLVFMKVSGGDVIGQFKVKKVFNFENFNQEDLDYLKKNYGTGIFADETYWEKAQNSNFGTLIFISESERFITSPIKIKKSDQRGWVVLSH